MKIKPGTPSLHHGHLVMLGIAVIVLSLILIRVFAVVGGRIAGDFFYPWILLPRAMEDHLSDQTLLLADKRDLAAEVLRLQKKEAVLEAKENFYQKLRTENQQLRELLTLPKSGQCRWIVAEILQRDPLNWETQFVLDAGSEDGVRPDAAVLAMMPAEKGNELTVLGLVRSVSRHTATVQTLLHPGLHLSLQLEDNGAVGFLNVNSEQMPPVAHLAPVGHLPVQEYRIGQKFVSSGMERHLPPGIRIGYLADLDNAGTLFSSQLFRTGRLRPYADYNLVRHVVIAVVPDALERPESFDKQNAK